MFNLKRKAFSMLSAVAVVAGATAVSVAVAQQYGQQQSQGVSVGDKAPSFTLKDTSGKEHSLEKVLASNNTKAVVLEWFNPDCPFVKKHHANATTMKETAAKFADKGVVWIAINSGAEGLQGAGLERNKKAVSEYKMDYPVLMDMSGKVGKAYGAKRTPEMFVIAKDGTIVYHGAIDNDRSVRKLGDVNYVKAALEAHMAGETIETARTQAYGCSVKYGG
ncbi:MAG: thioredoxin family protein [Planctomycetota bacterium]